MFSGTGRAKGSTFGEASFNERIPGGRGHETDKISPRHPLVQKCLQKAQTSKVDAAENDVGVSGQNEALGVEGGRDGPIRDLSGGGSSVRVPSANRTPEEPAVVGITRNVIERFSPGSMGSCVRPTDFMSVLREYISFCISQIM